MFYLIIGWIIVVGFAATLVITLLSLVGKITIEQQYKKVLFRSLVLEMVAAGFFIFYQGPADLDDVEGYFLFNLEGEPVEKVVSTFQKLSPTTFKETRRTLEINATKDTIFLKTSDDKTYLGFSRITDEWVSPEYKLYAGLYLCTNGDVKKGKPLLIAALDSPNVDNREKREGIIGLYKIKTTFNRIELDNLIKLTDLYTSTSAKHKEIGDIYSVAAGLQSLQAAKNESIAAIRDDYRLEALNSYLFYLKVQTPDSGDPKIAKDITKLRNESLARMEQLIDILDKPQLNRQRNAILAAAKSQDVGAIEDYAGLIRALKTKPVLAADPN